MDESRIMARSRASSKSTFAWDVWFAISEFAATTGLGAWWLEPTLMEEGVALVVTTALVAALTYAVLAWVH